MDNKDKSLRIMTFKKKLVMQLSDRVQMRLWTQLNHDLSYVATVVYTYLVQGSGLAQELGCNQGALTD